MVAIQTSDSPVLVLPDDEERVEQLKRKLEEYRERIASAHRANPNKHPGFINLVMADALYKKEILERLLRDGQVNTWVLSLELGNTYGPNFDLEVFDNACGVIDDYCKTGGASIIRGTGLQ
jgi:hypothetical protein